MKNLLFSNFFLSLSSILFVACGPPPPSCGDPALVTIPAGADASAPELTWMITQASDTPSGPISSIGPYTGATVNITVRRTDRVKVYLVARDPESGVRRVRMSGGFGQTCSSRTGAISASGIIPEVSQDLSFLTVCGMIQWQLPEITIDVGMPCAAGYTLQNLAFAITGNSENNKGGTSTSTLTITVIP